MKLIEFTSGTRKVSIVAQSIHAVEESQTPSRKGKANIFMASLGEGADDCFNVDQTYNEAINMIDSVDL